MTLDKTWQKCQKINHIKQLEVNLGFIGNYRTLRTRERQMNRAACDYCNGLIDPDQYEIIKNRIVASVKKQFGGTLPKGFFVNSDPRGYALKIADDVNRRDNGTRVLDQTDWGGYGLLAPDFN